MHFQRLLLLLFSAATASATTTTTLFGSPWNASDWVSSDDSVRGGASSSQLEVLSSSSPNSTAKFTGTLDFAALGGAGFASQRTIDGWPAVNLAAFDALVLDVASADGKKYTLNVFDTVPPVGSGAASVVWAYDFQPAAEGGSMMVLFEELVPTFQGRVVNDTAPLDLASIKRFSIMIRR